MTPVPPQIPTTGGKRSGKVSKEPDTKDQDDDNENEDEE